MTRKQEGAVLIAVGVAGVAVGLGVFPAIAAGGALRALRGPDRVPEAEPIGAGEGGKRRENGRQSTRERSPHGPALGAGDWEDM